MRNLIILVTLIALSFGSNASATTFCSSVSPPLSAADLLDTLSGAALKGINTKGEPWQEYLGHHVGRDKPTLFINKDGRGFPGRYKIEGNRICFSYGKQTSWSCKQLARCTAKPTSFVIIDDAGKQTSLINVIISGAGARYHGATGDNLAAQKPTMESCVQIADEALRLSCFDQVTSANIREFDDALASDLALSLRFGGQSVSFDRSACVLAVRRTKPVYARKNAGNFVEGGGWKGWLEDVKGEGKVFVGHRIEEFEALIATIHPSKISPSRGNIVSLSASDTPILYHRWVQSKDGRRTDEVVREPVRSLNIETRTHDSVADVIRDLQLFQRTCAEQG